LSDSRRRSGLILVAPIGTWRSQTYVTRRERETGKGAALAGVRGADRIVDGQAAGGWPARVASKRLATLARGASTALREVEGDVAVAGGPADGWRFDLVPTGGAGADAMHGVTWRWT